MRAWFALILAGGCNQIFGLNQTVPWDAAPPDAPFTCPPAGTALTISPILHQELALTNCTDYTASADIDLATALCTDLVAFGPPYIAQGPLEGPLVSAGLPSGLIVSVSGPRLSPDGDVLYLLEKNLTTSLTSYLVYQRDSDGTWTEAGTLPFDTNGSISAPTRGPNHYLMELTDLADNIYEQESDGEVTWTQVAIHTPTELGVMDPIAAVALSADGLRIVFVATSSTTLATSMMYADRAVLGGPFDVATPLAIPVVFDAFMNADCSRIYMSGLQQIFYAQQ